MKEELLFPALLRVRADHCRPQKHDSASPQTTICLQNTLVTSNVCFPRSFPYLMVFFQFWPPVNSLLVLFRRWGPVQLLKTQIRTTTMPPTVLSCTWTWGMKCACSWMGAKFTGETPTNTALSPASSSTLTDNVLTDYSPSVIKQKVSSPFFI